SKPRGAALGRRTGFSRGVSITHKRLRRSFQKFGRGSSPHPAERNAAMTKTIRSRLLVENVQGVLVITFAGEFLIDEGLIQEVREDLVKLVDKHRRANVLLNFREVQAMSSTMLAVLLKVARKVASAQGRLKLCSISPDLVEIFRITRFDRMF